jgi:type II secretory ATPase GspE/PulE/Tfp pilus assembly ATPase PilB-like protein
MLFARKKKEETHTASERAVIRAELSGRDTNGSFRRIRNVHWRTVDISPEMFVQVRDRAFNADSDDAREDPSGSEDRASDSWVLRICDYHFIMSLKGRADSTLSQAQRPEGQMRRYGFLPVGLARDNQLGADAMFVLVSERERPAPAAPYLRPDVWNRLMTIIGPYLRNDLHVILLGSGREIVERSIDFFYYHKAIDVAIGAGSSAAVEPLSIDPHDDDPDPIARARYWLREAVNSRTSDIHLEPGDGSGRVRMRIDGELILIQDRVPLADLLQAITWVKAQAKMNISERRRPLDGSIRLSFESGDRIRRLDVRISTIPTIYGQKMVMRLLDPEPLREMAAQGLRGTVWHPAMHDLFVDALSSRDGIILVTGPTGSGKTTTLNSALYHLLRVHGNSRNIVTVEDPVEYNVPGVNQIQINEGAEVTFAKTLRSILRQDPDIVLVGEIRDAETAAIAIQAALTGHLILATLHTNDAPSVVDRLTDLGMSPFLIASTVRLMQAQRLIRILCPACGNDRPLDRDSLVRKLRAGRLAPYREAILATDPTVFEAVGCGRCSHTGYLGRKALMEMVAMTPRLVEAIERRASLHELVGIAGESGYRPMMENGLDLLCEGKTSLSEIEAISIQSLVREPVVGDLRPEEIDIDSDKDAQPSAMMTAAGGR